MQARPSPPLITKLSGNENAAPKLRVPDETHLAITRVNKPDRQLVGWGVRSSHEGKAFSRYFSDEKHGGREAAYEAARCFMAQWGDRAEAAALLRRLTPRKNCRSGIPGVARYEGPPRRGPYWKAYWNEGSRRVQKRFAVSVYGEDKARELAIATRERGVKHYAERLEEIRQRDAHVLSLLPKTEDAPQSGLSSCESEVTGLREGGRVKAAAQEVTAIVESSGLRCGHAHDGRLDRDRCLSARAALVRRT